jgi:hypothetical protein
MTKDVVALFDEPLPPGAEVHTLKKQEWTDEAGYSPRLLKVTRTDGSCWFCRTTVQELPPTPITDIVAAMPDGTHFAPAISSSAATIRKLMKPSGWI